MESAAFLHRILCRQQRFRDKVEVQLTAQQPVDRIPEMLFELCLGCRGLLLRPPRKPHALDRMDHTDPHVRFAAHQRRINSGKMVLDIRIFLVPR